MSDFEHRLLTMGLEGEEAIAVEDLTKDYKRGRGLFDVTFFVPRNLCVGIIGENGAGKSTLMRHLMSFVHPDKGTLRIFGKDVGKEGRDIKSLVAYVPGEIAFPDLPSGKAFLNEQRKLLHIEDTGKADRLIQELQLDIRARPKKMSKGMKQKLALVLALMGERPLLLLDEPTTGLDPLMRERFLSLLKEEKARGTTILFASNTYEELEEVCDVVLLLSKGRIVDSCDIRALSAQGTRTYRLGFRSLEGLRAFRETHKESAVENAKQFYVDVSISKEDVLPFLSSLGAETSYVYEVEENLEGYFRKRRNAR